MLKITRTFITGPFKGLTFTETVTADEALNLLNPINGLGSQHVVTTIEKAEQ